MLLVYFDIGSQWLPKVALSPPCPAELLVPMPNPTWAVLHVSITTVSRWKAQFSGCLVGNWINVFSWSCWHFAVAERALNRWDARGGRGWVEGAALHHQLYGHQVGPCNWWMAQGQLNDDLVSTWWPWWSTRWPWCSSWQCRWTIARWRRGAGRWRWESQETNFSDLGEKFPAGEQDALVPREDLQRSCWKAAYASHRWIVSGRCCQRRVGCQNSITKNSHQITSKTWSIPCLGERVHKLPWRLHPVCLFRVQGGAL